MNHMIKSENMVKEKEDGEVQVAQDVDVKIEFDESVASCTWCQCSHDSGGKDKERSHFVQSVPNVKN